MKKSIFGKNAIEPVLLDDGWCTVAVYSPTSPDGQPARIDRLSLGAEFYRIVAEPAKCSVGSDLVGLTLTTGSGEEIARLAHEIATALAGGMLGMESPPT